MKLESLALWDERYLMNEHGENGEGFIGWLRGVYSDGSLSLGELTRVRDVPCTFRYEMESVICFLQSSMAEYVIRSIVDMKNFCATRLHDHIPYSFNRECWGFRVLSEEYAWYISLTPWNERSSFSIYCYNRKELMQKLAHDRGLPEYCYGILKYTGERIYVRFGASDYEVFPQHGHNANENRKFADEKNSMLNLSLAQVRAMENGVIYGWDTPAANIHNYDENGQFYMSSKEKKHMR